MICWLNCQRDLYFFFFYVPIALQENRITGYEYEEFENTWKIDKKYRKRLLKHAVWSLASLCYCFWLLVIFDNINILLISAFHTLQLKQREYENVKDVCLHFRMSLRLPEFGYQTMTPLDWPWRGLSEIFASRILVWSLCLIYPTDASLIKMNLLSWPQMA